MTDQNPNQNCIIRGNKQIDRRIKIVVLIVTLCAIVFSLSLNIAFHQQLYMMGLNYIYQYQTYGSNDFTNFFYNAVSFLGDGIFIPTYLVGFFLINKHKLSATILLAYFIINIYFTSILKSAFKSARPFWQGEPIQYLQYMFCSSQFGHPSGHSWISVLFFQPIFTDFLGTGRYYLLLIVPILTGVLIPISRMYLGMHSADQIVMGLLFSLLSLVLYRYLLQKEMMKIAWQFMAKNKYPSQILNPAYIILFIFNILAIIIPIVTFHFNRNNPLDQKLIQTINEVCKTDKTYLIMEQSAWLQGSIGNLFFGLMFGFLLLSFKKQMQVKVQAQKQQQSSQNKQDIQRQVDTYFGQFLTGQWRCNSFRSIVKIPLLYLGTIAIVGLPFFLPILFIQNSFITYFLASFGLQIVGFSISGIAPQLIRRFKLIELYSQSYKTGDDLRQNQLKQINSKKIQYPQTQRQISKNLYS